MAKATLMPGSPATPESGFRYGPFPEPDIRARGVDAWRVLLRVRYPNDSADVVVPSAVGDQHMQQTLRVEPIGLGAVSTAVTSILVGSIT
jgi:hypothetical protein